MVELLEFSSAWRAALTLLSEGTSVVLIAPRHYGKWTVLQKWATLRAAQSGTRPVTLSSRLAMVNGDLDYASLWNLFGGQLGLKRRLIVDSYHSFLSAVDTAVTAMPRDAVVPVLIGGEGRGHEDAHLKVLSVFHRLLPTGKLTIAATDDYSSFYYAKQDILLSDLHSLIQKQVGPISVAEIAAYLAEVSGGSQLSSDYIRSLAATVRDVSGGHVGLAQEILRELEAEKWPAPGPVWEGVVRDLLKRSAVLESISRAMEEDAEGYSRTANEYRLPAFPEQNSPRVHVLRQLGVLQRAEPPLVRLCEGAITRLVHGYLSGRRTATPGRVGTVVSEAGPRLFQEGPAELTDDDLVVVHLSDLHVGERYRHRLTWPGGQLNPNEQSAGELLREDLQSLDLLGRVDGCVLSGDFVWSGSPTEFRRARSVIDELLSAINLDLQRTVMVPGNHDVEWNPGVLGSGSSGNPVSRESYDDFLRLLGKPVQRDVEFARIASRSGSTELLIVGLDSNRVEGPEAAGVGFVSRESLVTAKKLIAERDESSNGANRLTWIVLHHHLFPATSASLSDAQRRYVSTMANAAEILSHANEWKAEAVLHGHEHQPCVTVARRWPVDVGDVFAPLASIGAGSFGVVRDYLGPFSRNQYYIIVRRPNGIFIRSRCQGSGGVKFVSHSDMWLPR